MPLSTEILESSFSLYKPRQGSHQKGGFTSLVAGLGGFLKATDEVEVRESFSRVKVKEVKEQVGRTVSSRRRQLDKESRTAATGATKTNTTS